MLRKLRLPIQDIQSIFLSNELSNELSYAVNILQKHLEDTRVETEELKALSVVIENIIVAIKSQENLENSLNEEYGFRHFGFNNPYPSEGNPVYGYEMWVVIPEDFQVVEPFTRKEFMGGMFAAVPAYLTNIGERWNELWDWVNNNEKYEIDWNPEVDRRWFEECIDYMQFNAI